MQRHLNRPKRIAVATVLALFLAGGAWPFFAQAAIVIRGTGQSNQVNPGTSVAVTKPTGVVAGDVLIASAVTNTSNGDVINPPAGWTQVRKTPQPSVSPTLVLYTWYKVAGGTEPPSYTFTFLSKQVAVGIVAYSGVNTVNPINAEVGQGSSSVSNTVIAPAITTTKPGTMLVASYAQYNSPPPSLSGYNLSQVERVNRKTSGGGSSLTLAMAEQTFAGPGTAPQRTVGSNRTSAPLIGHVVALRMPNQVPSIFPTKSAIGTPLSLSNNSVTLTGNVTDPDGGTIVSRLWSQVSGPSVSTIGSPMTDVTGITEMLLGRSYTFRMTAVDNEGGNNSADIPVTVPANQVPIVNAGSDFTLPYANPNSSPILLDGYSDDSADGSIFSRLWSQVSGPGAVVFTPNNTDDTTASGLLHNNSATNVYVFRLTATDNLGGVKSDDVQVTVPRNFPPTVNAGPDIDITAPNQTLRTLTGSTSDDPGGPPAPTVSWEKRPGSPAGGEISSQTSPVTDVTGLITSSSGVYTYRITATDNLGLTAFDEMTITVPPSYPPLVSAGPDPASIQLPDQNTVTLNGTVQSTGAPIASVRWTKGKFPVGHPQYVPNPPGDTIVYPIGPITDVTFTQGGTYNYLLTATDDFSKFATDTVQVIVTVAGNDTPVVAISGNTSVDISPDSTKSVALDGSYIDTIPGTPLPTFSWSTITRPIGAAIPVIESPTSEDTVISNLTTTGDYTFRLTVRDAWAKEGFKNITINTFLPAFSVTTPVTGIIWASSIGWISLGGPDGGNVAVHPGTGAFSGFAWAGNIGYINFAPEATLAFPTPDGKVCNSTTPCAKLDMVTVDPNDPKIKKASGWVRACSVLVNCTSSPPVMKPNSQRGGWDGWIKLYDDTASGWTNPTTRDYLDGIMDNNFPTDVYDPFGYNGVYYDDLLGFAWGGMVVGWIDFFGASILLPVPALGVIPPVSNPTLDLVFPPAPAPIPSGQLDFGDVWVGEPEEQDFTVVNLGDLGSFLRGTAAVSSVVDVDSDGDVDAADAGYFICFPASDCDYTNGVTTASSRAVTIQTTAPMTPGPYSTQITFTGINTVPQSSITRTVLGNAIVPVFQLGGNGLNFGNVVVKPPTSFRELTLRFRNDGLINLGPDTLMMPFPEYTCSVDGGASFQVSCPADLSPGFVNNILIRFTPTAVAAFNGEAFLFGHDTVRFMFTGAGVLGTFQFKDQ